MIREKAQGGKSAYAIGRELGISKNTARKYIARGEDSPPKTDRFSKLDAYQPLLHELMNQGIFNCVVLLERLRYSDSELPQELTALLGGENLHDVNDLCAVFAELDQGYRQKLGAVLQMVQPDDLVQARNLLKQLDLFDFIPKVSTPAEYGRYMIAESGRFEYDENLDGFYDYQKYGKQRMNQEQGQYVGGGYVSYHGFISIEEVLAGSETERMEQTLGGM